MSASYSHGDSLRGKSVIVTGAGRNLGRGISLALGARGASVLLVDIDPVTVAATAEEVPGSVSMVADVRDPATADRIVTTALESFGHLDALVNNAIATRGATPFVDLTDDDYQLVFDTGPRATFALMKAAHPALVSNGGGAIVNLGSAAGAAGRATFGTYGGAKEAVRGLSKVAANEWGPDSIRVNVICPFAAYPGAMRWEREHPEEFAKAMRAIPLGRMGHPEQDVGALVCFLIGDDSRYITGQTIFVDGGSASIR